VKATKAFKEYLPASATVDLGVPSIAPFSVPSEDRNRTSPFPFGGHRFEFRAVGSSQNVSMVNTVPCHPPRTPPPHKPPTTRAAHHAPPELCHGTHTPPELSGVYDPVHDPTPCL
jgi:hypothetical protein